MKNRVVVNICGCPYTILADESEEYVQKVSSYVDSKINDMLKTNRISNLDALVLTCLNLADDLYKANELNDSFRNQLKSNLDELADARTKIAELRREQANNGKNG